MAGEFIIAFKFRNIRYLSDLRLCLKTVIVVTKIVYPVLLHFPETNIRILIFIKRQCYFAKN